MIISIEITHSDAQMSSRVIGNDIFIFKLKVINENVTCDCCARKNPAESTRIFRLQLSYLDLR